MTEYEVGQLVRSLAGHDKGQIFVVVEIEEDYIWLADGKSRLLTNPKKKKIRHIQKINTNIYDLSRDVDIHNFKDIDVRNSIEMYLKKISGGL